MKKNQQLVGQWVFTKDREKAHENMRKVLKEAQEKTKKIIRARNPHKSGSPD